MTEADGVKALIQQVGESIVHAVAEGSTATSLGNETIDLLVAMRLRMMDSRVTALQALGHLQEAETQAQLLFNKTVSAEASDVIGQLRKAKDLVSTYVNQLANRIREAEKFINLMSYWVDTEMSASGSNLQVVSQKLDELYHRY